MAIQAMTLTRSSSEEPVWLGARVARATGALDGTEGGMVGWFVTAATVGEPVVLNTRVGAAVEFTGATVVGEAVIAATVGEVVVPTGKVGAVVASPVGDFVAPTVGEAVVLDPCWLPGVGVLLSIITGQDCGTAPTETLAGVAMVPSGWGFATLSTTPFLHNVEVLLLNPQ